MIPPNARDVLRAVDGDGRWSAIEAHNRELDVAALADAGLVRIVHGVDDDDVTVTLTPEGSRFLACR